MIFAVSLRIDLLPAALLLASAAAIVLLDRLRRRAGNSYINFSSHIPQVRPTLALRLASYVRPLLWTALACFSIAWTNPRLSFENDLQEYPGIDRPRREFPTEGIAIYLILDQSGSMREEVTTGRRKSVSKVDLLKKVTQQFIRGDASQELEGRPNDLIGLVTFARGAQVLSPLTLDHAALLQELSHLTPVKERDHDGTSIGYAIYKTASLIAATRHYAQDLISKGEPAYTIKNSIMVLVTDGMQDPNPLDKGKQLRNMDVEEAAEFAREQGIKLYIVNVDPRLSQEEFAPYRRLMQRAASKTGGKFYMIDAEGNLAGIYREIDQLEKSIVPSQLRGSLPDDERYRKVPLYPLFVFAGIVALLASVFLDTTVARRVP